MNLPVFYLDDPPCLLLSDLFAIVVETMCILEPGDDAAEKSRYGIQNIVFNSVYMSIWWSIDFPVKCEAPNPIFMIWRLSYPHLTFQRLKPMSPAFMPIYITQLHTSLSTSTH